MPLLWRYPNFIKTQCVIAEGSIHAKTHLHSFSRFDIIPACTRQTTTADIPRCWVLAWLSVWSELQNSSTVELVDHTYDSRRAVADGRCYTLTAHMVCYTSVDRNAVTSLNTFVVDLLYGPADSTATHCLLLQ